VKNAEENALNEMQKGGGNMLCLYRKKCYGAYFCTLTKQHCGIFKIIACIIGDLRRKYAGNQK